MARMFTHPSSVSTLTRRLRGRVNDSGTWKRCSQPVLSVEKGGNPLELILQATVEKRVNGLRS